MQTDNNYIQVRNNSLKSGTYQSLDYPVSIISISSRDFENESLFSHSRTDMELILVENGQIDFLIQDSPLTIKKGEGLFGNCNTKYEFKNRPSADFKAWSIIFSPHFLFGYSQSAISNKYLLPFTVYPELQYLVFNGEHENDDALIQIIQTILSVNLNKEVGYELTTKSELCRMWVYLLKTLNLEYTNDTSQNITLDEIRAKEGIAYITKHYSEQITLQEIAESVHISKSECCRCFKRCLQVTPFEYLLKYRIYSAISLMTENTHKIAVSEIAIRTGFNSSSYFNKIFRKYVGCTPSEYRQKILQGTMHGANKQQIKESLLGPVTFSKEL